jgi:hypothetical protein
MRRITLNENDKNDNKNEERKTQTETILEYNKMLSNLKVNDKVLNANIHELFIFFNLAFFNNRLDAVILEWSTKMTLCAGICYYEVIFIFLNFDIEWSLYNQVE